MIRKDMYVDLKDMFLYQNKAVLCGSKGLSLGHLSTKTFFKLTHSYI